MADTIQIEIQETVDTVDVGIAEGGGGGSATSFADLTDAGTADLPEINGPLATALEALSVQLSGKAPSSGISPAAISGTAVIATDPRLYDARTPTAHTHPASEISDATATGRSILTAANQAAARSSGLGSGATGDLLFQAASPAAAMETLGVMRRVTTTSYTSSSMTLEPAPELTFPVEAGKTYRVDLALIVSSLNAVGGVQVAMSYPALSRTGFGWAQTQLHATLKFPTLGASSVNLNTNTTGVPNGSTGLNGWVYLRPTSSGDVTFAAGQFSAGTGTVGILEESIITVTEL